MPASIQTDKLSIFAGIQPAGICRQRAILLLANCSILDPDHILHDDLVKPLNARQERLNTQTPTFFCCTITIRYASKLNIRVGQRTDVTWNTRYFNIPS